MSYSNVILMVVDVFYSAYIVQVAGLPMVVRVNPKAMLHLDDIKEKHLAVFVKIALVCLKAAGFQGFAGIVNRA